MGNQSHGRRLAAGPLPAPGIDDAWDPAAPGGPIRTRSNARPKKVAGRPVAVHQEDTAALQVVVVESEKEFSRHEDAWQDLADSAMESNAFYEPWLLRPALRSLPIVGRLRLVLVYEDAACGSRRMTGFFPLQQDPRFRASTMRVWRLWRHLHCYLCTPLLRAERSRDTLAALLHWAGTDGGADLLDFSRIHGDGPVHDALLELATESGARYRVTNRFTRAFWYAGRDFDAYVRGALSGGARKEYRRQRRRLAELGALEFRTLADGDDLQPWLDQFLRLEAGGWKAREGNALALHEDQRDFVCAAAQRGQARRQLLMQGLFLDGTPVAMLMSFLAGRGGFAFKIAYDETLAKYSPGVLLMLDVLHAMHARSDLDWMDSCAEPHHPMINRLWTTERLIESVMLSTGTRRGNLAVAAFPAAQRLVHLVRGLKHRVVPHAAR